jgi:hydroxyethylthiazole kinase
MTIGENLAQVRKARPLIHHLTNWVTIYDCANIVKVFGASPVMAHAAEEVREMTALAHALVLNIGTLTPELVDAMKIAAASANQKGIPVILDVCGAGATHLRDRKCAELIQESHIDVIKGNASEVARIAGENVITKGVDSGLVEMKLENIARRLSRKHKCCVVITGKLDIVCDEHQLYTVANGCDMMANIVGTGCMAASMIGTFCAVNPDMSFAAAAGLCCYEIAAEMAARDCAGPGTFKEKLYDHAFALDEETVKAMQKVEKPPLE